MEKEELACRIKAVAVVAMCLLLWAFVSLARIAVAPEEVGVTETLATSKDVGRATTEPNPVSARIKEYEKRKEEETKATMKERERNGLITLEDGSVPYLTLQDVKQHLGTWFSETVVQQLTRMVMSEDLIACSDTIWSAHVWCALNRLDSPDFADDLTEILADERQFAHAYTDDDELDPRVERIVRDVLARYVLEKSGMPESIVGRTLSTGYCFFRKGDEKYNYFYRFCWDDRYDPFEAPFNPYDD